MNLFRVALIACIAATAPMGSAHSDESRLTVGGGTGFVEVGHLQISWDAKRWLALDARAWTALLFANGFELGSTATLGGSDSGFLVSVGAGVVGEEGALGTVNWLSTASPEADSAGYVRLALGWGTKNARGRRLRILVGVFALSHELGDSGGRFGPSLSATWLWPL